MRYILIVLFSFYLTLPTFSTSKADSLLHEISLEKEDSTKIKLYNKIGLIYWNNEADTAKYYYNKAKELALSNELPLLLAGTYNLIGNVHYIQSDFKTALDYYEKSLALYEKANYIEGIYSLTSNIGNIYLNKGEYDIAIEHYLKAIDLAEQMNNKKAIAGNYLNIGYVMSLMEEPEKSKAYILKALNINEKINNEAGLLNCYINLGAILEQLKDYDNAITYHKKALSICIKNGNKYHTSMCYINLGVIHGNIKQLDKALAYYYKAVEIDNELGNKMGVAQSSINIAAVYMQKKDYGQSIIYGNNALNIGHKIEALGIQRDAYKALSDTYEETGNAPKALQNFKLYKQMYDSVSNKEKNQQVAELETKYESERKEKENEILRKDNEIQALAITKQKSVRNFILILLVFFLIIVLIAFNQIRVKKKVNNTLREKNQLINEQQEELKVSLEQVVEFNEELESQKEELQTQANYLAEANATKDKFFSIIAHDLKGPFNTILGFTNLLVEKYDTYDDEKRKKFISIIDASSSNTYKLLINLLLWARSQSNKIEICNEELNLYSLVDSSIEPYLASGINKNIIISNNVSEEITLSVDKFTVSTVIGNLINNSIKFTEEGGKIKVESLMGKDSVEIHITDTGRGISPEILKKLFKITEHVSQNGTNNESGTGLGLILCKEFVEMNEGKIEVRSEEGIGSTFTITLPLNKAS